MLDTGLHAARWQSFQLREVLVSTYLEDLLKGEYAQLIYVAVSKLAAQGIMLV